ncbi:MAG: thioesterase [Deltaproteobacteria bacterium]|nr:MAG: thioesterase [Deltaproteobacteria bacterium]
MSALDVKTHPTIEHDLCGAPRELAEGSARVSLSTTAKMAVDERGLVHGGFVFGAADHAAMLAVNDPNVVLGAAEARFLAPVTAGEEVVAEAKVIDQEGKKRVISASARVGEREVFAATFTAFVLAQHVLD